LGLRLDWTLFDGMEKYHKQKMNTLNAEKLANQEELLTQQLELKASNAKKQITVHANSLNLFMEQLKLAEKVFDQTDLKLTAGVFSSTDLINAENALNQAQTNVVSAYIQLRQAELEYLKAIGNIK
jgi:outer membrane protein TolC